MSNTETMKQVYLLDGLKEYAISGLCEYCFNEAIRRFEDDE